jgi:hypothetical protein
LKFFGGLKHCDGAVEDGKWVPVNVRIARVRVEVQDVVKKRVGCV